ncbi:hypothetical protein PoB_000247000 [Plakobranchus ocellatus]|uniref:Uncharacterized protein n=1 Tax=Plakobranchus ocellatus TaxID=259542 RepID=A0AAV3XYR8_9GAST|nr:hypothetical protein PoB_000247000 [Plakobranchus ocellatus]
METMCGERYVTDSIHLRLIRNNFAFLCIAIPQQGDLRLSGCLSGQGTRGMNRTCDRRVSVDISRVGALSTLPPSLRFVGKTNPGQEMYGAHLPLSCQV